MNFDFDVRTKRLEKEQQKRREDAQKKRDKELVIKANLQRLDEELRELNQRRKLEAEELENEKQRLENEERQLTGGIDYKEILSPLSIDGEDDKVILPESALESLSAQDSFGKGAAVFQLTVTKKDGTSTITHCGVREFSSAAGTIGLPPKVINSLWEDGEAKGSVSIKYVKLSKITYVKLQPKFNQFFKVEQVKMVLEENLKFHSTLTLGDIVTVWYRGSAHPLKVVEMKPYEKGILLDTDVEVDLDVSLENKILDENTANSGKDKNDNISNNFHTLGMKSENKDGNDRNSEKRIDGFPVSSGKSVGYRLSSSSSSSATSTSSTSVSFLSNITENNTSNKSNMSNITDNSKGTEMTTSTTTQNTQNIFEFTPDIQNHPNLPSFPSLSSLPSLPSEPELDSEDTISVRVRTPTGNTINRRFYRKQPFSHLFEFASMEMKVEKKVLQLTTRFPNRIFTLNESDPLVSFFDAGITSSQEMFLASVIV